MRACVYVTKSVSVDSVRNDIDAKKRQTTRIRKDATKKGDHKPTRSGGKRKRKKKRARLRVQQTPILEQLSRKKKTKEACNDGDGGE
jgi:hypothetical protein